MLTRDEIKTRFNFEVRDCIARSCSHYNTSLPLCEHYKECMGDDINRVGDFLLENPEPLAGDFPLSVADSFCKLRYDRCHGCPMQVDDTEDMMAIGAIFDNEEPEEHRWYCAFGFQEDQCIDDTGTSHKCGHKPDPEALREVLKKAKGEPDSLADIANRIARIVQKDESRYRGFANLFRGMLESIDES